jgi:AcrR family transcriptional regulator
MGRPNDPALRAELLDGAVRYASRHGIATLSLRPLAKALGTTAPLLVYHFGSKDALLVELMNEARRRQHAILIDAEARGLSDAEGAKALWRRISAPAALPLVRLFFEMYALALRDRARFPGFLDRAVGDWLDAIAPRNAPARERAQATVLLAAFRGFLLDVCASGDHARVDRAVDLFIDGFWE